MATHSKTPNVIKQLCNILSQKFHEINEEVIKMYARTRTFIRLTNLNRTLQKEAAAILNRNKAKKWISSQPGNIGVLE